MLVMWSSITGPGNILSASRIGIERNVSPAGLMTTPAPRSIASWIQSTSSCSAFDCRNSTGWPPAAARHIAATSASVVVP